MTEDERTMLDEALGRANAALSLARMMLQLLVVAGVMLPETITDGLDAVALATEEAVGDPRATPDTLVQLGEVRMTLNILEAAFRSPERN